eukprot:CAMPEP_0116884614 /NCGR_PEP_ID=MMETSP0463-20121206/17576_1 /TAXON_ID=181622 /ORGANISM="Strombidinopsis sp, Strain SopsisLIS2011" /LENGTH=69 /DNA_ID=CAMNT_0004541435 /DNA_START=115 /DNA_END=324 /DNA_ORIENTATION=+
MTQVMLSAPSPSLLAKLTGQLTSIIISTTQASPLNLLLSIDVSNLDSNLFLRLVGDPPAFLLIFVGDPP